MGARARKPLDVAPDRGQALVEAIETLNPPSIATATLRYRAEACGGDYVCGADGPWERVASLAE